MGRLGKRAGSIVCTVVVAFSTLSVVAPAAAGGGVGGPKASRGHEVWLVDQSNTKFDGSAAFPGYGGRIYIYDGKQLQRDAANAPAEVVEVGDATAAKCVEQTGEYPVRPHMLVFNAAGTHAVLAFVVSGHVVIYEAKTRKPVACFRTELSSTGRQSHAAVLTPDQRYILVANQNGKRLERIRTDYKRNVFVQEPAATLDLASGVTPNGLPVQSPDDPTLRPDNAPICPFVPSTGFPAYVSLRGGGAFAVDPYSTPIKIVAEYPASVIQRDGCGFVETKKWVYANGGNNATDLNRWFVYRLPIGGRTVYKASNPPNRPAANIVDRDTSRVRDAHGVTVTGEGKFVWAFDRAAHIAEVFEAASARKVATLDLRYPGSEAPATDIAVTSPDQRFIYTATRGPRPLSGAHAAIGDDPGVLVIETTGKGGSGRLKGHSDISNIVNDLETGDPHGVAVRETTTKPAPWAQKPPFKGKRYPFKVPTTALQTPRSPFQLYCAF